jgi:polysaccharide biosynthesis transport protein
MAQYEMNLRDYWMIVRRRRWIIVISTLAVIALSFWLAQQKVQVFQATSAVKFEQSASLSGLLVEVLSYSGGDNIETQAALIRSYTILEEVARRLGAVPSGKDALPRDSKAYRSAVEDVGGKLRTTRVGATSIIEITATSTVPREAADLANVVADVYRDQNRTQRNARIVEARKYIDAQLREIEQRLKRSEDDMWAFRDDNQVVSPGAESSVLVSLFTQIRLDIERARQQRTELESAQARLLAAERAPSAERIVIDSGNAAIAKLQGMQVDLLLERSNLGLELTDRHPRVQAIDDRLREVRREMRREVAAHIAHLKTREGLLQEQLQSVYQRNRAVPAVELGLARLQREQKSNDDLAALLKAKRQEALIKEAEVIEEVAIIRPAIEPDTPVSAQTFNTVVVGAFLGLVLGLVLAFIQETLDTSIGTIEDVETYLDVPVLGVVPHIDTRANMERLVAQRPALAEMDADALASHALLITHFDPKSPVAEAYRTLRTKIQFARLERMAKTIVVTSPTLQEGKTTTIVNLALTMAQNGQKTLLLGSNLRRPSIYRFFGIEREPGLSDILIGNAEWRDCIRTVADILMGRFEMEDIMASPGLDNLHIIEAGPIPANPSELLSTPAMGQFLRAVREEYDVILIDTPPVLPVTDSTVVASQVDAVVLVYQAGKVGRLVLKRAKIHLESARARVLGVVLNDVQTEVAGYQYAHYYTHYYGEETPAQPSTSRVARIWQTVRAQADRLRGRLRRDDADVRDDVGVADDAPPRMQRRAGRRGGYRNTMLGIVVLAGLTAVLVGALAWRFGPSVASRPRDLLRGRLDARAPGLGTGTGPAPVKATVAKAVAPAPVPWDTEPSQTPAAPPPSAVSPARTVTPKPLPAASTLSVTPKPLPAASTPPEPTPVVATRPAVSADVATREPVSIPPASDATTTTAATTRVTAAPPVVAPPAARFAVELGPFPSANEATRVEERLHEAGYPTMRVRRSPGGSVYAVLIEKVAAATDAEALVTTLREQGFGDAAIVNGSDGPTAVRVGAPLALRGAVALAERLRGLGHVVRLASQPDESPSFVIRHGNFASRAEAGEKGEALKRLGLTTQIIQVR